MLIIVNAVAKRFAHTTQSVSLFGNIKNLCVETYSPTSTELLKQLHYLPLSRVHTYPFKL